MRSRRGAERVRYPACLQKEGLLRETEKKDDTAAEAVSGRMGIFAPGHHPDRDHGVLADDPGIYHVTSDRLQCKHGLGRTDFQQLYANVPG